MVDEILLTPEEQDERAKQWLKDNGVALILGVVLGLGAVFGYNTYKDQQIAKAESASSIYEQVLESIANSENADISEYVETLKSEHAGSPYAAKAVLLKARQLSVSDLSATLSELQWVADNSDELGIQHTARIRSAKVQLALGEFQAAKELANTQPYDGFDTYYQEILGDIAVKQDDVDAARVHYQAAIDELKDSDIGYRSILDLKMNRLPSAHSSGDDVASDESSEDTTQNEVAASAEASEPVGETTPEEGSSEVVEEQASEEPSGNEQTAEDSSAAEDQESSQQEESADQ